MMADRIGHLVRSFEPISLTEMDSVKLMTRSDQKFLCRIDQLPAILEAAWPDFRILEINGIRLRGYESLYLDTADHRMYLAHHNGHLNRYKIRIREYQNSHEFFLEVKFKDNHSKTTKKRISIGPGRNYRQKTCSDFIRANSTFSPEMLKPVLFSAFDRITLVNNVLQERITIDINPAWHNGAQRIALPGIVIIEVKAVRKSSIQGFGHLLREARIHPVRLSKYCTGTILLYPNIKHNRFKVKMLQLAKLDKTLSYA